MSMFVAKIGWIPSFIEMSDLDFSEVSAESFAALQQRVLDLEERERSVEDLKIRIQALETRESSVADLQRRIRTLETRVCGSTAGKIAFVDRIELDKFVADNSRLLFSEGVKAMEDRNWDVPKMMKKLRSFFSSEEHQGGAFWFSMAAQNKYFKTPVNAASKDGRQQGTQATGSTYGPARRHGYARGASNLGRPFSGRSQRQRGGRDWF
jgi:hypothetical protein